MKNAARRKSKYHAQSVMISMKFRRPLQTNVRPLLRPRLHIDFVNHARTERLPAGMLHWEAPDPPGRSRNLRKTGNYCCFHRRHTPSSPFILGWEFAVLGLVEFQKGRF